MADRIGVSEQVHHRSLPEHRDNWATIIYGATPDYLTIRDLSVVVPLNYLSAALHQWCRKGNVGALRYELPGIRFRQRNRVAAA